MEFDYVIVGGGSAGCVLANRLSADPKVTVCLLEAGGEDRNPWIHIPAGYIKTMVNPSLNWLFETQPHPKTAAGALTTSCPISNARNIANRGLMPIMGKGAR